MSRAWFLAAAVVLLEALLAALGVHSLVLAAGALLAPGCALAGLLPGPVRRVPLARVALMPALGLAASSVALISVARLGIPLTGVSVRVVLVLLMLGGLAVGVRREVGERAAAVDGIEVVMLGALLALAAVLGWQVVGEVPVPGNDWAKYLLYADEIHRHHKLLLDNPFWLGGVGIPFREDPGMPALQGSALILSGAATGALAQGILALGVALVLAVYGYARAYLGRVGGLAAAAVVTVIPASQNILGWHGLANLGALVIVALVLAQLAAWLIGDLDRRGEAGLALALVGVAAAHRLTSVIVLAVVGCVALSKLVGALRARGGAVRVAAGSVARIVGWLAALGILVALDIRARSATAGGTLDYTSYLATKVQLDLVVRDITWPVLIAAPLTLVVLGALRKLPAAVWPAIALGLTVSVLGYVWVIHLPLYYARMVFYLPLAVAPVVGAGVAALAGGIGRRVGVRAVSLAGGTAGIAVVAVMAASAWSHADTVRTYYAFANPASLRGLDALAVDLRPGEPVTTDRCWSFLSAWLLRHPTYPALADQDIGPSAELPYARMGRSMIEGTKRGNRLVRKLGVRYALVDPNCPATDVPVLPKGNVVFESQRLAIVKLSAGR